MSYKLRPGEPLGKELQRVVKREFEKAADEISKDPYREEAVHEVRKSVKKVRAVLRLVRDALGKEYEVLNDELRSLAHQMSWLRDVDATVEIMKSLRDHNRSLITPSVFAAVCKGLAVHRRKIMAQVNPERLLTRARTEIDRLADVTPKPVGQVADSHLVRTGLESGYKRARKAMAAVLDAPEDLRYHTWRRRVKDHWYHMRVLERFHSTVRSRASKLRQLETWLGDDHNLVLLRMTILEAPARFGNRRQTAIVLGCVAEDQNRLRRRALKIGQRLFSKDKRAFRHSVERWWQQAHSIS
jgi:hypothetical protein